MQEDDMDVAEKNRQNADLNLRGSENRNHPRKVEALYRRLHIPSIAIRSSVESSCELFFDGKFFGGVTSFTKESYSTRVSMLTICISLASGQISGRVRTNERVFFFALFSRQSK